MGVDESTGARIAAYRKRKGMPQAQLAGLAGRSESWLSQVERGAREVAARYALTARMLPPLLTGVDAYGTGSRAVALVRGYAYVAAAKLLTKVGDADLAWIAADRRDRRARRRVAAR